MESYQQLLLIFIPSVLGLEWAVHVKGGENEAKSVANRHHMDIVGEVIPNTGYFLFRTNGRSKRSIGEQSGLFHSDSEVDWVEVQTAKVRVKRVPLSSQDPHYYDYKFSRRLVDNLLKGRQGPQVNDPMWKSMWYLNRQTDLNMNVAGAWSLGFSGLGVAVTILDDGIEKDHPDLIKNYDPLASTDINDNDSDPNPRYDFSDSNRHGTRCAGQVAATPNNSLCAIGVAFNSQIGGIRMLDGQVSDAVEARSLSFNSDHIQIYSSSWGPNDDGKTVDGPGKLAHRAFQQGIYRGRDGKGSIFVWASGNGGRYKDNCNCDGYATSIYTITVSSTSEGGHIPWYSEACSATLATTYSSGTTSEKQIVTTDLHHKCTTKHTGTSASAPMAAGIIALTLEANPSLTWRDVQHIIVRTSRRGNLHAKDWAVNDVGRNVSHNYGYGLMDAEAMVTAAQKWNMVAIQQSCEVVSPYYYKVIPSMGFITIELEVNSTSCPGVNFMEHVVSPIHVTAGRKRGDLRIYLSSPGGTRSTLLDARPQDFSGSGFNDWGFMTTHCWGENPSGKWVLEIHNDAYSNWGSEAKFFKWSLKLFGTSTDENSPRSISEKNQPSWRNNVVREAPLETLPTTSTLKPTIAPGTLTPSPKKLAPLRNHPEISAHPERGCISKVINCTKEQSDCRIFQHRTVADVFCKCTPGLCLSVASYKEDQYNLQCTMADVEDSLTSVKRPFYCQFIPLFSYR